VYRAGTIDITPTRPEHVLLVAEVVSPGSETTDRIVKVDQYAKAGIAFYWRIEQAATGVPLVYTYVLDPATKAYRDGDVFMGILKVAAPFAFFPRYGTLAESTSSAAAPSPAPAPASALFRRTEDQNDQPISRTPTRPVMTSLIWYWMVTMRITARAPIA